MSIQLSITHVMQIIHFSGMGGVDLCDRLLSSYRPTIMGKKWWWSLFINAINVSVVAAWRLHCQLHPLDKLTHLQFRRQITLCLLKTSATRAQTGGGHHADLPTDVRFDGVGHIRMDSTQGRCVLCGKNCRHSCEKCNVRLHTKQCFESYHCR